MNRKECLVIITNLLAYGNKCPECLHSVEVSHRNDGDDYIYYNCISCTFKGVHVLKEQKSLEDRVKALEDYIELLEEA